MTAQTILVVDDDPGVVEMVISALEYVGYNAAGAVDGEAVTLARRLRPALILLDMRMPHMDGAEVSKRLRADPRTAHIPIVVMSAEDRVRGNGLPRPFDGALPKPFDVSQLYATVQRWVTAPAS